MIPMLFCLLVPLAPFELGNKPEAVDDVSSWIIMKHCIMELKDGTLCPLVLDPGIEAEWENGKWLVRYKDGFERLITEKGNPFKTTVPLHRPVQDTKGSLRKRLHPKDDGSCWEPLSDKDDLP